MTGDPSAGHERIHAALTVKRPQLAIELAEKALQQDPDDATVHCLLAIALRDTGDHDQARASADRALALDAANPWHWHTAAITRLDRRWSRDEALELLDRALSVEPDYVPAHVAVAHVLAMPAFTERGRRNLARADRHANIAMRLAPDDPDGYVAMSRICEMRGDGAGARWFATEAVRRDPVDPESRNRLADAAAAAGDLRAAGDHYTAAGQLDPSGRSLRGLRGLRYNVPISLFGLWIVLRVGTAVGRSVGIDPSTVLTGAAVVLVVIGAGYLVLTRHLARRKLSPNARQVLREDRRNRRSRLVPRLRR